MTTDQGPTVFFRRWVIDTYAKQDIGMGDYAREKEADPCAPRRTSCKAVLRAHLDAHGACQAVYDRFEGAYAEYVSLGLWSGQTRTDEEELRLRMRQILKRPEQLGAGG